MNIAQDIAHVIKELAKAKGISTTKMLEACNLNKNTLSSMQSRGSMLKVDSLAKIADYLDCSVDYLLGRTDIPNISSENTVYIPVAARGGGVSYLKFTLDEYMEKINASPELSAPQKNNIPLDE